MAATREDIFRWLREAKEDGCSHLIVMHDTYDHENYPVYVPTTSEFWAVHDGVVDPGNMQVIEEVYDMHLPIAGQMAERRALHTPPREDS